MGMSADARIVFGVKVERAWDGMSDEEQEAAQEAMDDEWIEDGRFGVHGDTTYDEPNDTFVVGLELTSGCGDEPEKIHPETLLNAEALVPPHKIETFCTKHRLRPVDDMPHFYLIANYS